MNSKKPGIRRTSLSKLRVWLAAGLCASWASPALAQQAPEAVGAGEGLGVFSAPVGPAAGSSALNLNTAGVSTVGSLVDSPGLAGLSVRPSPAAGSSPARAAAPRAFAAGAVPAAANAAGAAAAERTSAATVRVGAPAATIAPVRGAKAASVQPSVAESNSQGGSRVPAPRTAALRSGPAEAEDGRTASGIRTPVERDLSIVRETLSLHRLTKPADNEDAYLGGADLEAAITHRRSAPSVAAANDAAPRASAGTRAGRGVSGLRPASIDSPEPNGEDYSQAHAAGPDIRPEPTRGPSPRLENEVKEASAIVERLRAEVGRVIVGQREMVDSIVMTLIAGEHELLEGNPGLAKTLAVTVFADATSASFSRIQGTSDKLPSDILGAEILQTDPQTGEKVMKFVPGPIFANIVLVDEINRMTPKTQSALLEAMQERQVTVNGVVHKLPRPFILLATQNPIEQEGVNHLPEAQQDRFMRKTVIDRPSKGQLKEIMGRFAQSDAPKTSKVVALEDLARMRAITERVYVDPALTDYITDIVEATHEPSKYGLNFRTDIQAGASPRAAIALLKAARIQAFLEGRAYVTVQDVKTVAPDILRARVILNVTAKHTTDEYVQNILDHIGPGAKPPAAAQEPEEPSAAPARSRWARLGGLWRQAYRWGAVLAFGGGVGALGGTVYRYHQAMAAFPWRETITGAAAGYYHEGIAAATAAAASYWLVLDLFGGALIAAGAYFWIARRPPLRAALEARRSLPRLFRRKPRP